MEKRKNKLKLPITIHNHETKVSENVAIILEKLFYEIQELTISNFIWKSVKKETIT